MYIYFSDVVPSQNSYVVTEKPLACSQGTSKYADYPLHSCMPWFIDPSEQFENTELKKKNLIFFPVITSPSFLMGMQFGKGRGLFLKLYLLCISSQEMKNDSRTPLVNSLMRQTSAGKSQKEQSTWGVMPMRASLLGFSWIIFEQDSSACRGILFSNTVFHFPAVRGGCSPPQHPPLFPPLLQAFSFTWDKSRAFHLLFTWIYLEDMWSMSVYRRLVRKGITGHVLHHYFCNDDQKCFKPMLKSDNRQWLVVTFICIFLCLIQT